MSRFINQSEDIEHLLLFFVIRLDFRTFLTFYRWNEKAHWLMIKDKSELRPGNKVSQCQGQ